MGDDLKNSFERLLRKMNKTNQVILQERFSLFEDSYKEILVELAYLYDSELIIEYQNDSITVKLEGDNFAITDLDIDLKRLIADENIILSIYKRHNKIVLEFWFRCFVRV